MHPAIQRLERLAPRITPEVLLISVHRAITATGSAISAATTALRLRTIVDVREDKFTIFVGESQRAIVLEEMRVEIAPQL